MEDLRFDPLTGADLEQAVGLSTDAGWNQTAADWGRLLDLAPDGCIAGRLEGRLVATATVASYAPALRWIGMLLVARSVRRRGIGTAILRRAVALAGEPAGIDVTDRARPLCLGLGFVDLAPLDRWVGRPRPVPIVSSTIAVHPLAETTLDEALAFDRAATGVDRGPLFRHLLGGVGATGWLARDGDRPVGLGFLRPGRAHWHLGPLVATGSSVLAALISAAAGQLGAGTVVVDAMRTDASAALLAAAGLRLQRRLTRMMRPGRRPLLGGDLVAAGTAPEWG